MTKTIDYLELEQALHHGDADFTVTESQAIATGMLVVNIAANKVVWLKLIVGEVDSQNLGTENNAQNAVITALDNLFEQTKYQLQDTNLEFDLLLPEDDESLSDRFNAVQDWCRGFLTGVSLSGVKNLDSLQEGSMPEDTRDLLKDIANISSSGDFDFDEEEGEDAESEEALAEIIEYLRVGALLINEELQPIKSSAVIH